MISASDIESFFNDVELKHILVIGDLMLDRYFIGSIDRISPEAPVPVVNVKEKYNRLGGAANVALNLKNLGAEAHLLSVRGDDMDGTRLEEKIKENNITASIIIDSSRPTTVKTRIISKSQQVLRVDEESIAELNEEFVAKVKDTFREIIKSKEISAIVLQDYDKGFFTEALITHFIQTAKEHKIPVSVDPKKKYFHAYKNCSIFKPNLSEAEAGLNISIDPSDRDSVHQSSAQLSKILDAETVVLTLSEYGLAYHNQSETKYISAHKRDIADVSGAGDTFISVLTAGLAVGLPINLNCALANIASGLVCEEVGVVPINAEKLKEEALEILSR